MKEFCSGKDVRIEKKYPLFVGSLLVKCMLDELLILSRIHVLISIIFSYFFSYVAFRYLPVHQTTGLACYIIIHPGCAFLICRLLQTISCTLGVICTFQVDFL
jgi:hypothetical protein